MQLNFKKIRTQGDGFSDEEADTNEAEHFRQMSAQLQMYQNQIVQLQSQLNTMNNMSTMHSPFPPQPDLNSSFFNQNTMSQSMIMGQGANNLLN